MDACMVAAVKAFAEPCAGAGVALFVGAGFSYGSFNIDFACAHRS